VKELRSERITPGEGSSTSAFSFNTRMTARLVEQTLIGS
jgi:hypothetical protein